MKYSAPTIEASVEPAGLGAETTFSTIRRAEAMRYLMLATWAVGLGAVVGWRLSATWLAAAVGWGVLRGFFDRRQARRERNGRVDFIYVAVATINEAIWSGAPILALSSGRPFGDLYCILAVVSGIHISARQLARTPVQAFVITSPFSAIIAYFAMTRWGTAQFWPLVATLPLVYLGVFSHIVYDRIAGAIIKAYQKRQDELISALEIARDTADRANQTKSAFLGVVSHELRTPMNGVLGAAQLLEMAALGPAERRYVTIIRESGEALMALLNDILDMTKIEADRMTLEAIDVDLHRMVERIGEVWTARAEQKALDYSYGVSAGAPSVVIADPTRISQIIHNMLSNAIKFTEEGAVRLEVIAVAEGETTARLAFRVEDTGPGISSADAERLFRPFEQLDPSNVRRYGGTGLGLDISRKLARLMGGDLTLSSEPGQGTTFTLELTLPVRDWSAAALDAQSAAAELSADRSLRVLVAEDHPVNQTIIRSFLTLAGHQTTIADNGQMALEAAAVERFDVILMDVNMPVMDGLTATRALRAAGGLNCETPVIMVSASARTEDHQAGYDAGADGYVSKPIDMKQLAAALEMAGEGRDAMRARAAVA